MLGSLQQPTPLGWLVFLVGAASSHSPFYATSRGGGVHLTGLVLRAAGGLLLLGFLWFMVQSLLSEGGRPGTIMVTFIYAFVGTAATYLLGLGLAILTSQRLAGERLFRIIFLLPLTITPVGIAYMFRMITDTQRGPFAPLWSFAGLSDFAPLGDPWGARIAVMIGDVWQWTPFMFIVLLAALESRDMEVEEAGLVDGARKWQILRYITLPALIPVSATVILIRLIEAFKIIDLPNILTNGGPGTATESLTLQAFIDWRDFNLGQSAAIAYTLLVIVTDRRAGLCHDRRPRSPGERLMTCSRDSSMRNRCVARDVLDLSPRAKLVTYALCSAWTFVVLFPLYWLVVTSFKLPIHVNSGPGLPPVRGFRANPAELGVHPHRPPERHGAPVHQLRSSWPS